jgi:hypothetical protein
MDVSRFLSTVPTDDVHGVSKTTGVNRLIAALEFKHICVKEELSDFAFGIDAVMSSSINSSIKNIFESRYKKTRGNFHYLLKISPASPEKKESRKAFTPW